MLENDELAVIHFFNSDIVLETREDDGRITVKTLGTDQLLAAVKNLQIDSGWLTDGVKRWGRSDGDPWFIALYPAARRKIWIGRQKKKTEVPMPALVFAGRESNYWIFAARHDAFDPEMKLYWLDLPNVQGDFEHNRAICWGNNRALKADSDNVAAMWKLFWNSPFAEEGINKLKKLEGAKEFPAGLMEKEFGTIRELAGQLARKGEPS